MEGLVSSLSLTRSATSTTSFYAYPSVMKASRSGGGLGSSGYVHPAWRQRTGRSRPNLSPLRYRPVDPQKYRRLELPIYGGNGYLHTRKKVNAKYLDFLTEGPKHPPKKILPMTVAARERMLQREQARKKAEENKGNPDAPADRTSNRGTSRPTSRHIREEVGLAGREDLLLFELVDKEGDMAITFDQVFACAVAVCLLFMLLHRSLSLPCSRSRARVPAPVSSKTW